MDQEDQSAVISTGTTSHTSREEPQHASGPKRHPSSSDLRLQDETSASLSYEHMNKVADRFQDPHERIVVRRRSRISLQDSCEWPEARPRERNATQQPSRRSRATPSASPPGHELARPPSVPPFENRSRQTVPVVSESSRSLLIIPASSGKAISMESKSAFSQSKPA